MSRAKRSDLAETVSDAQFGKLIVKENSYSNRIDGKATIRTMLETFTDDLSNMRSIRSTRTSIIDMFTEEGSLYSLTVPGREIMRKVLMQYAHSGSKTTLVKQPSYIKWSRDSDIDADTTIV